MNHKMMLSRLSRSFDRLFDHDTDLFDLGLNGVHEQSLTFRLGSYLQQEFPALNVDCEYNRREHETKKRGSNGRLIKPDIVVHKRKYRNENSLVIEAKKKSEWDAEWPDLNTKLCDLTAPGGSYGYTIGMCWKLNPSRIQSKHRAYWFSQGALILDTPLRTFQYRVLAKLKELGHAD